MRGFLSLEVLIVLLALLSAVTPLAGILVNKAQSWKKIMEETALARSSLAELRSLIDRAIVEGEVVTLVEFPSGTLSTSGGFITLEVNGETFSSPSPIPLHGGSWSVSGVKMVRATVSAGEVSLEVT